MEYQKPKQKAHSGSYSNMELVHGKSLWNKFFCDKCHQCTRGKTQSNGDLVIAEDSLEIIPRGTGSSYYGKNVRPLFYNL
jgi:hypothetical protein